MHSPAEVRSKVANDGGDTMTRGEQRQATGFVVQGIE
jgi:hypothetical protein